MRIFNTTEEAFAYYAECALATAEGASLRKSTSKREMARLNDIASGMVAHCVRAGIDPRNYPRLQRATTKACGVSVKEAEVQS